MSPSRHERSPPALTQGTRRYPSAPEGWLLHSSNDWQPLPLGAPQRRHTPANRADALGQDIPRGTLHSIIDQAGLTVEEFIDLL
jgi:hypothetical protein